MIDVRNLTKIYGNRAALDGLSFSVPKGAILGFLGPNGAGKTTTMRILTGQARATAGTAEIDGCDVQKEHRKVRSFIGYLPEDSPAYPEMTVEKYLAFMAGMKLIPRREISSEIDRVLTETRLVDARKRLCGNLSKGMRQRVGIAQAMMGDPKVIILDEPTVGLDPSQITHVRDLIKRMAENRTVIFSTHILPNVSAVCSHVVIINNGKIVTQGPVGEIGRSYGGRRLVVVARGDKEKLLQLAAEHVERERIKVTEEGASVWRIDFPEEDEDLDIRPQLSASVVSADLELLEISRHEATLEDIFIRATNMPQTEEVAPA